MQKNVKDTLLQKRPTIKMQKTSQICHCKKTAQAIRPTGRTLTRNCAFNCSLELCILGIAMCTLCTLQELCSHRKNKITFEQSRGLRTPTRQLSKIKAARYSFFRHDMLTCIQCDWRRNFKLNLFLGLNILEISLTRFEVYRKRCFPLL